MRLLSAFIRLALVGSMAANSGCGGKSQRSAPDGSAGSIPMGQCPAGIPSPEELARTPREDPNLELLALKFSSGVVADQSIYDRVVGDVAAIRKQNSSLGDIAFSSSNDGRSLMLTVDAPTYQAMQAGAYDSWSCLNDAYGAAEPRLESYFHTFYAELLLRGIYNMVLVDAQYAELPGVQQAGPTGFGDGPTICLTREGDTWHYVFDAASGDCEAGCSDHEYFHFISTAAGVIKDAGTPSSDELRTLVTFEACH